MSVLGRLDDLRLLRGSLLEALGVAEDREAPGDVARVSSELRRVLSEIAEIEAAAGEQKGSVLDELTARRAARRTGTAG